MPALVAAGTGLLLSLIAAYAVGRWEQRVTKAEFEGVAATELIVLQNGINEYLSRLVTLRTLFESTNEEITRSEFEVFSGRLFENHPGILRVGWVPRIKRKERADYEAAAVNDGVAGYQIKSLAADGGLSPAPQSDEYFPVFFSTEPKTSVVYGLDYSTDPMRWATLERARDNDAVAVLPTKLVYDQKGGGTHGVLVSVPVYVKGTSRTTIADRRRNLAGYVVGIFDLAQLLQSVRTATAASSAIAINAYPPDLGRSAGPQHFPVPDYSSAPQTPQSMQAFATGPRWSGALRIGDANWQVQAIPAAGGRLTTRYDRALIVLAAGLIVTIFVVVYLGLASRNSRQIALANRRVLELAQIDTLTGLPNRAFFLEQLEAAAADARERPRGDLLGPDARSRPLQERQRFAGPRRRRRLAPGGGGPPAIGAARHRRAGAAGRRRIRHHPGRLRRSEDGFDQSGDADLQTHRRAVPVAGPSGRSRHQHRYRDGARARQRSGAVAEKGRPCAVSIEIGGPQLLHALR